MCDNALYVGGNLIIIVVNSERTEESTGDDEKRWPETGRSHEKHHRRIQTDRAGERQT